MRKITHWIGGAPSASSSERWGDVFDPATGAVQATVPFASAAEIEAAVIDQLRAMLRARTIVETHGRAKKRKGSSCSALLF